MTVQQSDSEVRPALLGAHRRRGNLSAVEETWIDASEWKRLGSMLRFDGRSRVGNPARCAPV
jgi:hypothetical protein